MTYTTQHFLLLTGFPHRNMLNNRKIKRYFLWIKFTLTLYKWQVVWADNAHDLWSHKGFAWYEHSNYAHTWRFRSPQYPRRWGRCYHALNTFPSKHTASGLVLIILVLLLLFNFWSQAFQLSSLAPVAVTERNVPVNPTLLTFVPRTLLVIKVFTSSVLIIVTTAEIWLVVSAVPLGGALVVVVSATAGFPVLGHLPSVRRVLVHAGDLRWPLTYKFPPPLPVKCTAQWKAKCWVIDAGLTCTASLCSSCLDQEP